ncbi:sorting nexin-33-like isoform X2 [Anneissia japonica]|uniref:sorting nexin-33-like isoform X2 n=1 Tax=Anneissia japonica TaxID=1529436 RepID=UPI00142559BD|nr:sorting nexin-33-like isoform X2 [Anneissia japonica]
MALQVRVLYDFQGEPGNGELTIYENDILDVIRQDVGDGWWEGQNPSGHRGLFPEAYVEVITTPPPPSFSPPPVPQMQLPTAPMQSPTAPLQSPTTLPQKTESFDDWDEDWDEESSYSQDSTQEGGLNGQGNFGLNAPNREYRKNSTDIKSGTVRKNYSRFSVFSKSGGEAYLMGNVSKKSLSPAGGVTIIETDEGPQWEPDINPFQTQIRNPKKESKLKGIKSFICYQITPSNTGIQVSRRYKHFDWLYERLVEKFITICVPALPDKQVTGRYEETFIEKRMEQLQRWMSRMTNHPVISRSEVFQHFVTCTDEKLWKVGKRKAEKGDFAGAAFFSLVQTPQNPLDLAVVEQHHDNFHKFVKSMDESLKQVTLCVHEHSKKHIGPFKREYNKLGASFSSLAASFELDNGLHPDVSKEESQRLTSALNHTGKTYSEIGNLYSEQPKQDLYPLEDSMREYTGMLACFPDMISFHKHTLATERECQKSQEDGKIDGLEAEQVRRRADVISYSMMAEMNHFHQERVKDYKEMMQRYLQEQIKFYETITNKLQENLAMYGDINT